MYLACGLDIVARTVIRIAHLGQCNDLTLMGALSGVEMGLAAAGIPYKSGGVTRAMNELGCGQSD